MTELRADKEQVFNHINQSEQKILSALKNTCASSSSSPSTNHPSPLCQTINFTSEDKIQLEILKLLQDICTNMNKPKRKQPSSKDDNETTQNGGTGTSKGGSVGRNGEPRKRRCCRTNISKYCWSCGAWHHTSKNCKFKKPGHKDDTTFTNKMGGSTLYCIESNEE